MLPRQIRVVSGLGAAVWLWADMAVAQQNLIVNGGFEGDGKAGVEHFPGWQYIGPADNNSNYGVAHGGPVPDAAQEGDFYAYFHGHPTDNSQDCLGQGVNLIVGREYTVSYYLGTDGSTLGSGASMWVVVGASFGIDYSQDVLLTAFFPNSPDPIPYQKFTTNFTATASSEILSFHGFDSMSSILLDNVSLTLAAPPILTAEATTGDRLVLAWSNPAAGYRLEVNASPASTNWVVLTNAPVVVGTSNLVVLPKQGASRFYRLAQF